jgi:hypothetical protein
MAQLKVPKGSEAKARYHLGQLRKMFARANDHAFLQMIWAVDASMVVSIAEFRSWLKVPEESYAIWRDLRRFVIDPAVKEINEMWKMPDSRSGMKAFVKARLLRG